MSKKKKNKQLSIKYFEQLQDINDLNSKELLRLEENDNYEEDNEMHDILNQNKNRFLQFDQNYGAEIGKNMHKKNDRSNVSRLISNNFHKHDNMLDEKLNLW